MISIIVSNIDGMIFFNQLGVLIRFSFDCICILLGNRVYARLLSTLQLLCTIVLHLDQMLKLTRIRLLLLLLLILVVVWILLLLRLLILISRCKAVIVDIDAKEFTLPVCIDHKLDSGNLLTSHILLSWLKFVWSQIGLGGYFLVRDKIGSPKVPIRRVLGRRWRSCARATP